MIGQKKGVNMKKIIFILMLSMMFSACVSTATTNREYGPAFDPYRYMNGTNK
jgi:hypothetical protein